jgi:hypothetical protein
MKGNHAIAVAAIFATTVLGGRLHVVCALQSLPLVGPKVLSTGLDQSRPTLISGK